MRNFMSRNAVIMASALVVAVAVAGGGYYWVSQSHNAANPSVSLAQSDVCALAVDRARDYGVLPPNAKKADGKTVDTVNSNRVTCGAKTAEANYALTADVMCDDAKNTECLVLQKVTHENGTSLYDTHI